ncbi:hypothetical protein E2320_007006, partial [Naja naja]
LHPKCQYLLNNKPLIRSELESTEAGWFCRRPTTSITNMFTVAVNDNINDDALKSYDYPCCLLGGIKRYISNEDNAAEGCACGVSDCICLMTTEVEDSDDSD